LRSPEPIASEGTRPPWDDKTGILASTLPDSVDDIPDVAVVGAGPVGLTAAIAARARGLRTIVIEAESENRTRPGSRALFLHTEPLAELAKHAPGIDTKIYDAGMLWGGRRYFFRGKEFYRRTFPPASSRAHGSSLSQVETERILIDEVRAQRIPIRWNTSVTGVHVDDGGVTLETDANTTIRARYVIGCDGARSAIRKAVGIAMAGENLDSRWVIVDVGEIEKNALPPEMLFHYEHPALDGLNVLIIPFKGGWRIDVQCKTQADVDKLGSPEGVRAWIPRIMDAGYADTIRWISTYRFNKLTAERFTDDSRRVILAGEAAHLFPPFGGRGLNSGIMDAVGAVDAISRALVATTPAEAKAIIDEVATDRRDAARFNMEASAIGVRIMSPKTLAEKAKRRAAVAIMPWSKRARYWMSLGPNGTVGGRPGKAIY
jgi:3-(3-hydroxy-phenyl)propionate hydroxylase